MLRRLLAAAERQPGWAQLATLAAAGCLGWIGPSIVSAIVTVLS